MSWLGILRLALVQASLGAIVVLTTSTMNRVMVVELALPAILPGLLVALHYAVQVMRPRMGHGSDAGGRCTPWIIGGMAALATGGIGASASVALMSVNTWVGVIVATVAFLIIGLGVGASGTSLLVLLAKQVEARRRPAAATITWIMMIAGFVVTTAVAGRLLEPYSHARLVEVTALVAVTAFLVTVLAVWRVEPRSAVVTARGRVPVAFRDALKQVWNEPTARQFTLFVFVSMLAYSGQDLILEPFAGAVLGLTPAESTRLSSLQNSGVLAGMIAVAIICTLAGRSRFASLRGWSIAGCVGSALALAALAMASVVGSAWPLRTSVWLLGLANGAFAVAAIGSMMSLAGAGRESREGVRMGLWGAAQAVAFALGGIIGTGAVDLARSLLNSPVAAYSSVFAGEAIVFLVAAVLASQVGLAPRAVRSEPHLPSAPRSLEVSG